MALGDWLGGAGGGLGNFGDSGGGFDWGSVWGGGSSVWGDALTGAVSGSSSSWWKDALSGLLGGGGGGGSNGGMGSNIFSALLAGLGGAADAKMGEKELAAAGKEQRKTLSYTASLEDHYRQKEKQRKRVALDTYGQFSLMDRWAPNRTPAKPIDVPALPTAG